MYDRNNPPDEYKARWRFSISNPDINLGRRCIVAYVYDPADETDMPCSVRINGTEIATVHPVGGIMRGGWSIFDGSILYEGTRDNRLEVWSLPTSPRNRGSVSFKDVVIWFRTR